MSNNLTDEIEMQRRYYAETANLYDTMHLNEQDEHFFALSFMVAALDYLKVRSILDIGSGTGRAIRYVITVRTSCTDFSATTSCTNAL